MINLLLFFIPWYIMSLFSGLLSDFLLITDFKPVDYNGLWSFSCLRFVEPLECEALWYSSNVENFISSNIFPIPPTPVCFGGTPGTQPFGHFEVVPRFIDTLFVFPLSFIFSLCFIWDNFYCFVFKFTNLFFWII